MGIVIEQLIYTCVLIRLKGSIMSPEGYTHSTVFFSPGERFFFFSNGNAGGREWEVPLVY